MTIWEGIACLPLTGRRLEARPPQHMTADSVPAVSLSYPLDYARYLVGKGWLYRHLAKILRCYCDHTKGPRTRLGPAGMSTTYVVRDRDGLVHFDCL